jgi:HSP20 family molecular chaperone IbpA
MGPNNNSPTVVQPTNNHCCCNGQYCKSSNDMDNQSRFVSMREDFDRLNKNIFGDFTSDFPTIGCFDSNITFSPLRFGLNWDLGSTTLQNTSNADHVKISNEIDRLEMVFDTTGFEKEDLKINRKGQILTVEGRHAEKSSDESNYVSKQFSRSYTLPSDCNMDKMKSCLSNNKLNVSIPKNTPEHDTLTVRQVPIDCSDKKDFSFSKKSAKSNTGAEECLKSGGLLNVDSKACSNHIRNVPISVEKLHCAIPEETTGKSIRNLSGIKNKHSRYEKCSLFILMLTLFEMFNFINVFRKRSAFRRKNKIE